MKIETLIFFLIYSTLSFSQDSIVVKNDTFQAKKEVVNLTETIKKDTLKLDFNNSSELSIPIKRNTETKVILVKEKSKIDFLKYLFPVFTLLLGIWVKKLLDKRNYNKRIEKSGKRWLGELRSLEDPLKKQIQSLEEFLIEHKKEEFLVPKMSIYSSLNGEIFKSLDKNELIEYIETKHKKIDFKEVVQISNRIHGYTSILVHLNESLKDKFNKYLNETSIHTTSLSRSLQSFNVAFANYGAEIENEIGKDPITDMRFKPIADLYSKYILPHLQDGKFNPFKLETDFFIPLLYVLSHLRLDDRTKPLSLSVSSALNSIKGIKMEKLYMEENINTILGHYKEQLTDLNKITKQINNQ